MRLDDVPLAATWNLHHNTAIVVMTAKLVTCSDLHRWRLTIDGLTLNLLVVITFNVATTRPHMLLLLLLCGCRHDISFHVKGGSDYEGVVVEGSGDWGVVVCFLVIWLGY